MDKNLKEDIKNISRDYLELSVSALSGDDLSLIKLGEKLINTPLMIKNIIYYENFQKFLKGMGYNDDVQRKFLEYLNDGDKEYKSKKILLILDNVDSDFKSSCIINLTKSVSYGFINQRYYMKLCQIITVMITEDLIYLKNNIENITPDSELIDEFERNGLMYLDNSRTYVYSKLAHDLDQYGLSYGDAKYDYTGEKKEHNYPDKFQNNMTFTENEEPDEVNVGDDWLGN